MPSASLRLSRVVAALVAGEELGGKTVEAGGCVALAEELALLEAAVTAGGIGRGGVDGPVPAELQHRLRQSCA